MQLNYRYFHRVTPDELTRMIEQLRAGELDDVVPPHGTLARVRQDLTGERIANITPPEEQGEPVWIARHRQAAEAAAGEAS